MSRLLVWNIHDQQVAPIALVRDWQHWIVVVGFTATAVPTSSTDTSYAIQSFDVNDPFPAVPGATDPAALPPPPHNPGDNCGVGGNRGIAAQNISYSTWQSTYMTGVPSGFWKGQFVAVGPPATPAPPGGAMAERVVRSPEIIGSEQIVRSARTALQAMGLDARPAWAEVLGRTTEQEPVLVQRLDRPREFYYIVPFGADPNSMMVAVCFDAFSGAYSQSALYRAPTQTLRRIDVPALLDKFSGYRFEVQADGGFVRLLPNTFTVHPTWVWKPCRESLSPYYPFRLIESGAHRLYERSDGPVFAVLRDNYAGL
jgi:hypothetical protein